MLAVDGLVVRYGRTVALHGIELRVAEGELVSLVGANGAGKSTALKAIVGLVPHAAGSVTLEGSDLRGVGPEALLRRGVALVPEGRNVFGSLTVAENLALGAATRRDRAAARREIAGYLDRFPALGARANGYAGLLSGGEQQQLAIARALLAKPRLLLLDEPSLGLAPLIVDQIFDLVTELHRSGTTVLLVEQNATRAVEMADRSYVLRTGRVALTGDARTVLDHEDFVATYLGAASGGAAR